MGHLALLLAVIAHSPSDGRICSRYSCAMCMHNHLTSGHHIDGWSYSDPWSIHKALHNPVVVKPKKLAKPRLPFNPTPMDQVAELVEIVKPRHDDVIYDPGCGDARLLIALCKDSGATGVGFEINSEIAELARKRVDAEGLTRQIVIWNVDSRLVHMDEATVVVMYLFPVLLEQLDWSKARVTCSYIHQIRGVQRGDWWVSESQKIIGY